MEENQTYKEFAEENFIIYRKKEEYSPVYFVPKSNSKYKNIFIIGDFSDKEKLDYNRNIKKILPAEFIRKETNLEMVENGKDEFIRALVDYIKDNHNL